MKLSICVLFFWITSVFSNNMDDEAIIFAILVEIQNYNCNFYDSFYINCHKPKTFFEETEFIIETGITDFSKQKMLEFKINSFSQEKEKWEVEKFEKITNKFITKIEETCNYFEQKRFLNKKEKLITFHNPIFDNDRENCIITVVLSHSQNGFSSQDYFLTKIYGKWIIVSRFNFVIS